MATMAYLGLRVRQVWAAATLSWAACCLACPGREGGADFYVQLEAQAISTGLPVMDLGGDWRRGYAPRRHSQRAWLSASAEAGYSGCFQSSPRRWALGLLTRGVATAKASGQAADIVRYYQGRIDPGEAGRYDASVEVLSWQGRGLTARTTLLSAPGWSLELGAQWLQLLRWQGVSTSGWVDYLGAGKYDFNVAVQQARSGFTPTYGHAPTPQGQGMSLSLSGDVDVADLGQLSFFLGDVWSRLSWSGLNLDDAVANSRVADRADSGYLAYQPVVQGRYRRAAVHDVIPITAALRSRWVMGEHLDATLEASQQFGLWQRWVGIQSAPNAGASALWRFSHEPVRHAWQLDVKRGAWALNVGWDRPDSAGHLRRLGVSWAY